MADISQIFLVQQTVTYLTAIPSEAVRGNVFAIVFCLIILYIAIYLIQKFTTLLVFVLKKTFLLIIVVLAFYEFVREFSLKIAVEGITTDIIIIGTAGAIIGLVAIFIALYMALRSIFKLHRGPKAGSETSVPAEKEAPLSSGPMDASAEPRKKELVPEEKVTSGSSLPITAPEKLSLESLKNDKHIGAVIAYIIIAEFGVFSSKTIAAPTFEAGLLFFIVFLLASVVFIRLTYHDYWRGLRHLIAALVIGGILSIFLGYIWGGISLDQLLSFSYFTTDALVALITGLALSLFMGSMN